MAIESTIQDKEFALGVALARMYIAAQGVSLAASDKACEAIEEASVRTRLGVNFEMSKSPFNVRATI